MNPHFWQTRSHLTRGARLVSILLFGLLAAILIFVHFDPNWLRWTLFGLSLTGMVLQGMWAAPPAVDPVEREQEETEEFLELANQAIRNETQRLDNKRIELEKVLMIYGECMEFPDFQKLQSMDWQDEAHRIFDERVALLIDSESDQMLQRFSSGGAYWKEGSFDGRQLLLDIVNFTERIACIYQPDSERPLLELNLESLLKAVNRASLQIILLLEELPVVDVKQINLRKFSDGIRTASQLYSQYEKVDPYLKPARYIWHGGKVLLLGNPLFGLSWAATSEVLWKYGKKWGKRLFNSYLLGLLRQSLGIIAWETASIYDSTHRYRSPDWIYGVELAHLLSRFDTDQKVLREAFKELGKLPLRSSYDRIFLYRCIAQNVSSKPDQLVQSGHLSEETRQEILTALLKFHDKIIRPENSKGSDGEKWKAEVTQRLAL